MGELKVQLNVFQIFIHCLNNQWFMQPAWLQWPLFMAATCLLCGHAGPSYTNPWIISTILGLNGTCLNHFWIELERTNQLPSKCFNYFELEQWRFQNWTWENKQINKLEKYFTKCTNFKFGL